MWNKQFFFSDQLTPPKAGWEKIKIKGSEFSKGNPIPKMAEALRLRIYDKLPRYKFIYIYRCLEMLINCVGSMRKGNSLGEKVVCHLEPVSKFCIGSDCW